jgi:Holliday junction resolvase RusA-like endonuclease
VSFEVRIVGHPIAQPRAGRRHFIVSGRPTSVAFDHERAKDWKRTVLVQVLAKNPPRFEGPVAIVLDFYLPRPLSLPKRVFHHMKKPDLDNLVKAIKDAVRGTLYHDDRQIVMLTASKGYGDPGVRIFARNVPEDQW